MRLIRLSEYDFNSVPNAEGMKFGIVVSEWNFNITGALLKGAVDTLKKHGAKDENILVKTVPGSFDLLLYIYKIYYFFINLACSMYLSMSMAW